MKKIILIIVTSFFFLGCKNSSIKREIVPNFYLFAPDVKEQVSLSYHQSDNDNYSILVDATIYEYGFNDKYIVVKRYSTNVKGDDKKVTNFYIQPILKGNPFNWKTMNNQIGPLTLVEFQKKCREIGINITFRKVYE